MQQLFKPQIDPAGHSPLELAYLGDAVYELLVRQHLVRKGANKMNRLHRQAVKYVRADTQAKVLHALEKDLNSREQNIVRRGRNAKSGHVPKHARVIDYRYSTGFESLVGYLYLIGDEERLRDIIELAAQIVQADQK
ncbi:MAG: ribonuclease III [Firmicutes bacterium]|nr:ribonuclease III [Bacillota bacterium]